MGVEMGSVVPPRMFYDKAEGMDVLVWRLCEYRNDRCDKCPATAEMPGHGACKAGCRAIAEEMIAIVLAAVSTPPVSE